MWGAYWSATYWGAYWGGAAGVVEPEPEPEAPAVAQGGGVVLFPSYPVAPASAGGLIRVAVRARGEATRIWPRHYVGAGRIQVQVRARGAAVLESAVLDARRDDDELIRLEVL
jgi:hypothetical protein